MNACDINVRVYAMREDSPHHEVALRWLESALAGEEAFGWHPLMGASLIRVATNRRVFADPSPPERCLEFIDAIIAAPAAVPPPDPTGRPRAAAIMGCPTHPTEPMPPARPAAASSRRR